MAERADQLGCQVLHARVLGHLALGQLENLSDPELALTLARRARSISRGGRIAPEIAELPLDLQPKLLRFPENAEVFPLGGQRPVKVDVRVLARHFVRQLSLPAEPPVLAPDALGARHLRLAA